MKNGDGELAVIFTLGLISDTHGLLRPEAFSALEGTDLILHAGDVGNQEVLSTLRQIAPVRAVAGNMDTGPFGAQLRRTEIVETGAGILFILHDLNRLDLDPQTAGFAAIISGHTHRPAIRWEGGVLYFNPGSAGPQRSELPISVGKIEIKGKRLIPQIIPLGQ